MRFISAAPPWPRHKPIWACMHTGCLFYAALSPYPPSPQEKAEKLEQLRILWHGEKIALLSAESKSFGIDTPDDLSRARMIKNN